MLNINGCNDEGIHRVKAGHRRVLIRETAHGLMVDRRRLGQRVGESPCGQHARRCSRQEDVEDQSDRVREDHPVSKPREVFLVTKVHPEEHPSDDDELRQPVRVRRQRREEERRVQPLLKRGLEERADAALESSDRLASLER